MSAFTHIHVFVYIYMYLYIHVCIALPLSLPCPNSLGSRSIPGLNLSSTFCQCLQIFQPPSLAPHNFQLRRLPARPRIN